MAAKKKYLFSVQRDSGHEVLSAVVETAKVSDVEVQRMPDGMTRLVLAGAIVAWSTSIVQPEENLTLHRWEYTKRTTKPVSKPVEGDTQ